MPPPTPDSPSEQDVALIAEPTEPVSEAVATPEETRSQYSIALAMAEEQLYELVHAREQRTYYAKRIFRLVRVWLILVGYAVMAQGFGSGFHTYGRFDLSDSVIIALLTTTTATVIGALLIVLNYLFPKRGN